MRKILFVCHGNICRSPMAEYILKYLDKNGDYYAESRAISSEELGNDIYPPAKRTLEKHGIPYQKHCARRITNDDYKEFDEIYVMENSQLRSLKYYIDDSKHKIFTLQDFDIEDPWYSGNYEKVYNEIYNGIIKIMDEEDKSL